MHRVPCAMLGAVINSMKAAWPKRSWRVHMLKRSALAAAIVLGLMGAADAQAPRKGGTLRMTAPYGSGG